VRNLERRSHFGMMSAAILIIGACAAFTPSGNFTTASAAGRTSRGTTASEGLGLAESLLATALLPRGAVPAAHLQAPLIDAVGDTGTANVHQTFVLQDKVDIVTFVKAHRPDGAAIEGPNTESGSGITPVTSVGFSLPSSNRHVAFEGIDYSVGYSATKVEELRVDVHVDWVAIHTVEMPTTGVATLTGYERASVMRGASGPTSVVLTRSEVLKLHDIITSLPNVPRGACMEDSALFSIRVAPGMGMPVTWTAIGDACPGYLNVTSGASRISLADTTCSLRTYILSLLPQGKAEATRTALKFCGPRS
jgi:hypothetical protein